ncbi:MAG: hypothetical protein KC910_25780 [Candidatus Eremiobacteraeota bacterium]|nr:hypothetical protein [Candidatus Eremiobacteraeota bacterium]
MSALQAVIQAANAQRDEAFSPELREALRGCEPARIAAALPAIEEPAGAGLVAVWLGALVEQGQPPECSAEPILDCFLAWTRDLDDDSQVDQRLALGLRYLGQALVAHLGRSEGLKLKLAQRPGLLERLEELEQHSVAAIWLGHLLRQQSGRLLVLHAIEPVGALMSYHNLTNCAHLFSLLQAALEGKMPGARTASREIVAVARGQSQDPDLTDAAWWHFGQGDCPGAELGASVWAEAAPSSISWFDDHQVMLLWPPILGSRSWNTGFFGPHLEAAPADVRVDRWLTPTEVTRWRQRLRL